MPATNYQHTQSPRSCALGLLARRDHSPLELAQKLLTRGYDHQETDDLIDQLKQENLLNEYRYCESFIHQRRARGQGPVKIKHELRQRGIAEEIIEESLDKTDEQWFTLMCEQRNKKFGADIPDDYAEQMKQARFLQNRGFSADAVMRLFR